MNHITKTAPCMPMSMVFLGVVSLALGVSGRCPVTPFDLSGVPQWSETVEQYYNGQYASRLWSVSLCALASPPAGANYDCATSGFVADSLDADSCYSTWNTLISSEWDGETVSIVYGQSTTSNRPGWTATVNLTCDPNAGNALIPMMDNMIPTGSDYSTLNFPFTFWTSSVCSPGPNPPGPAASSSSGSPGPPSPWGRKQAQPDTFSFTGAYVFAAVVFGLSFVINLSVNLIEACGYLSQKANAISGIILQLVIVITAIGMVVKSTLNYTGNNNPGGVYPCGIDSKYIREYEPRPQNIEVADSLLFFSTSLFALFLIVAWAGNSIAQFYNSSSKNLVTLLQFIFFAMMGPLVKIQTSIPVDAENPPCFVGHRPKTFVALLLSILVGFLLFSGPVIYFFMPMAPKSYFNKSIAGRCLNFESAKHFFLGWYLLSFTVLTCVSVVFSLYDFFSELVGGTLFPDLRRQAFSSLLPMFDLLFKVTGKLAALAYLLYSKRKRAVPTGGISENLLEETKPEDDERLPHDQPKREALSKLVFIENQKARASAAVSSATQQSCPAFRFDSPSDQAAKQRRRAMSGMVFRDKDETTELRQLPLRHLPLSVQNEPASASENGCKEAEEVVSLQSTVTSPTTDVDDESTIYRVPGYYMMASVLLLCTLAILMDNYYSISDGGEGPMVSLGTSQTCCSTGETPICASTPSSCSIVSAVSKMVVGLMVMAGLAFGVHVAAVVKANPLFDRIQLAASAVLAVYALSMAILPLAHPSQGCMDDILQSEVGECLTSSCSWSLFAESTSAPFVILAAVCCFLELGWFVFAHFSKLRIPRPIRPPGKVARKLKFWTSFVAPHDDTPNRFFFITYPTFLKLQFLILNHVIAKTLDTISFKWLTALAFWTPFLEYDYYRRILSQIEIDGRRVELKIQWSFFLKIWFKEKLIDFFTFTYYRRKHKDTVIPTEVIYDSCIQFTTEPHCHGLFVFFSNPMLATLSRMICFLGHLVLQQPRSLQEVSVVYYKLWFQSTWFGDVQLEFDPHRMDAFLKSDDWRLKEPAGAHLDLCIRTCETPLCSECKTGQFQGKCSCCLQVPLCQLCFAQHKSSNSVLLDKMGGYMCTVVHVLLNYSVFPLLPHETLVIIALSS